MAVVGLKRLHVALLTDEATNVYALPSQLSPAVSSNITPNFNTSSLYGDDRVVYVEEALGDIDVEIAITDLTDEDYALVMGVTPNADGVIEDSTNDQAPYLAIGFEMPKPGGGVALRWYYKGKFKKGSESATTKGENVDFQTPTISAKFMAREDGKWRARVDYKDAASIDAAVRDAWFTKVYEEVVV
ncbi:MAG: phage tail protein [Planococcaceae bacterium]|nr:phage tail protein [Planococcaceae bacterium]